MSAEKELPKGFITKEEWIEKGRDPDEWRSPEEFEKRGEEILPIVQKNLAKTREELQDIKQQMDFVLDFNKKQEERIRNEERQKVIAEYEKKRDAAFDNDDKEALVKAEKERDEKLKKTEVQPQYQPQGPNKAFEQFKKENEWYGTDEEMTKWADKYGRAIGEDAIRNEGKSQEDAFKLIAEEVKARFRDKIENTNRTKQQTVEGSATSKTRHSSGETWDDIPPEAQKQYNKVKAQLKMKGREYKKEDFVSAYFS